MTPPREMGPRPTRQEGFTPAAALDRLGLRGDRIAFGLAGIGGAWGPVDQGLARETLRMAIAAGVGVFDVAPAYGTAPTSDLYTVADILDGNTMTLWIDGRVQTVRLIGSNAPSPAAAPAPAPASGSTLTAQEQGFDFKHKIRNVKCDI